MTLNEFLDWLRSNPAALARFAADTGAVRVFIGTDLVWEAP